MFELEAMRYRWATLIDGRIEDEIRVGITAIFDLRLVEPDSRLAANHRGLPGSQAELPNNDIGCSRRIVTRHYELW